MVNPLIQRKDVKRYALHAMHATYRRYTEEGIETLSRLVWGSASRRDHGMIWVNKCQKMPPDLQNRLYIYNIYVYIYIYALFTHDQCTESIKFKIDIACNLATSMVYHHIIPRTQAIGFKLHQHEEFTNKSLGFHRETWTVTMVKP